MIATHSMGQDLRDSVPPRFFHVNEDGQRVKVIDKERMYQFLIANDLLPKDAAKEIDEMLVRVARRDRVGVADLISRGLTRDLQSIGITTYEFEHLSPVSDAEQHMSIIALPDRDRTEYNLTVIPVPVTSSQFRLDARESADPARGEGVDTTNVEEHTRAVERILEDVLTNGSSIVLGGNSMPGYTNHTPRKTVTLSTNWDDLSEANRDEAASDVLEMRRVLRADGFDGPYVCYIPANWDGVIDDDYKPEGTRTLRERILAIDGVEEVKVLPSLADDNALLVQMTQSVVQKVTAQETTVVTWDLMGGLARNWAVMEIGAFALKTSLDEDGNQVTGIAHLS